MRQCYSESEKFSSFSEEKEAKRLLRSCSDLSCGWRARAGKPVCKLAPLVPVEAKPRRKMGTLAGKLTIPDDFDAPLPDDLLDLFEGR